MSEVMTWAEIEAEFDGEWVLIEKPSYDGEGRVIGGRVLYHSSNWMHVSQMCDGSSLKDTEVLLVSKELVEFLINWGLPGGYGIYDWSKLDLRSAAEQGDNPD